jgi:uncharacterized tellurite resistance protein B-like protein
MSHHYHLGLLCLTHLLVSADGVLDDCEVDALQIIKEKEGISNTLFESFHLLISHRKEREIFQTGIDAINQCTVEQRIRVFVMLYKLSEVDGRVHVKEIRLLLYALKLADVEFDEVVNRAMNTPALL